MGAGKSWFPQSLETRFKGITLRTRVRSIETLHGSQGVERVLTELPAEVSDALRHGALQVSGFYPIRWFREFNHAVERALDVPPSYSRELGRVGIKVNLTTVHKGLLTVFDPAWAVTRLPTLVRKYMDRGSIDVIETRKGYGHIKWSGFPGFDHSVWLGMLGNIEGGLELCGARNIRARITSGGADGDDSCEMVGYWT